MIDLLQNPAVQGGIAPFLVALAVAALLARTRFLGLAQVAGFTTAAALAIGLSFESLSATRKLVLIGLACAGAVLVVELAFSAFSARIRAAFLAMLAAACVWMLWRLLVQRDILQASFAAVLAAGYVVALAESTLRVSRDPVSGAAAGLMVGLGTGALAVLGASALLGLAAISVGAAAGAGLLVQMLRGQRSPVGSTISLPAATVAGLAGVLAVLSAALPWYCLTPVLAAPWATRLVSARFEAVWLRAVLASAAALVPMLIAIGLAWTTASAAT